MPVVRLNLDLRTCVDLSLSLTVWCSGCSMGRPLTLPSRAEGKLIDMFDRLRCKRCGAPPLLLTAEHRLSRSSIDAEIVRLERRNPADPKAGGALQALKRLPGARGIPCPLRPAWCYRQRG